MKTKPTCKAIRDRLTLYLMGDLDPQTQATMAQHLAECDGCRVVADRLEPTLRQLRDALEEPLPDAPTSLSPEHRQRVLAAFRQRKQTKRPQKKRKPLLLRFHILEMAAVLIAGLMIISLVTANFGHHGSASRVMVRVVEPEMMVEPEPLEDIQLEYARDGAVVMDNEKLAETEVPGDMSVIKRYGGSVGHEGTNPTDEDEGVMLDSLIAGSPEGNERNRARLTSTRNRVGEAPDEPVSGDDDGGATISGNLDFANTTFSTTIEPPEPTEVTMNISADMPPLPTEPAPKSSSHDFIKLQDAEFSKSLNVPVDSALAAQSAPNLPEPIGQVQSVAKNEKTKRQKANVADKKIAEEMSGDFISLEGAGLGGASMVDSDLNGSFFTEMGVVHDENTAPESGERAAKKHRSTDAPHAVAMQAKGEREEKKDYYARSDDRSKSADFIAIEGANSARAEEELDGLRIKAAEMREIISELRGRTSDLRGPISDTGSESSSVVSREDNSVMLEDGKDVSYEMEREELEREVQDLTGQIKDMRGQLSDVLSAPASGDATVVSGLDADMSGINAEGWKYDNAKGRSDDSRRRQNAPAASGPAPKKEAVQNVPLVGDIPVTGRLMARDEVLSAREEREREGEEEELLAEEDDLIALKPQPSPDPAPVPDEPESDVSVDDGVNDPFAPRFKATGVNPFVAVSTKPFSTFSIDVDTASYTLARNYMLGGHLPPPEAVRTEEFVNFFDYAYQPPVSRTFRVASEIAPSRFGRGKQLLKLGVKGRRLGREEQRPAALTFLIDSSGSMNQPDRLGLVRRALEMLLNELAETDQVAIIQFDNRARLILAHTPVRERKTILKALDAIQCGGGTNLETGLQQAYEQAAKAFVSRGENRILLLSDGVVNLGEIATESITAQIEASRRQGLYLSVFGFGMGIYDDTMLKALATKGNGSYAFIDSETEARRVFVDDLAATLNTIAEDVKIQIQFNPKRVAEYRQLGYESRQLTKEQFRDDTVNAGEVGSGQSVTALYELDLADTPVPYAAPSQSARGPKFDDWIAIARVRYRRVDNGKIEEIEQRITEADILPSFDAASTRFRLAAGVAAFAEILRGSPFAQGVDFDDVASVLRPVALDLHLDHRIRELVQIVETAGGLTR